MVKPEEAVIVNALVRQALVATQEVMGENGLNAVLRSVGLERFIGSFQLSMELPRPIMPNQCTAKLVNGLLVVNFPKAVERRHRSFVIPVKEDIS